MIGNQYLQPDKWRTFDVREISQDISRFHSPLLFSLPIVFRAHSFLYISSTMAFVSQFVPPVHFNLVRGGSESSTLCTKRKAFVRVPCAAAGAARLTPQDREYINKVRDRLMHRNDKNQKISTRAYERPAEVGEEFSVAMQLFNTGQYAQSVSAFESAVDSVGGYKTSSGGKVALWLSQALDACGARHQAIETLEKIRTHSDPEVAATAVELLFIVTAPKLEVPRDQFLHLPLYGANNYMSKDKKYNTRHLAASGLERRVNMKKPVEKYSLEWYAKQRRPTRSEKEDSTLDAFLFSAFAIGALSIIFGSGTFGL